MGLNWKIIREELSGVISDSLYELVEGAEEDLKAYGVEIANSLIIAMRTGRADLQRLRGRRRGPQRVHGVRRR